MMTRYVRRLRDQHRHSCLILCENEKVTQDTLLLCAYCLRLMTLNPVFHDEIDEVLAGIVVLWYEQVHLAIPGIYNSLVTEKSSAEKSSAEVLDDTLKQ